MSSAKSAMTVFRFLTPGQLAICSVLFFMPWVEVQCGMPNMGKLGGGLGNPNAAPPKLTRSDLSYSPILTQSGFQAAKGDYEMAESVRAMMDQGKKMAQDLGGQAQEEKKEKVQAAPVLWLFPAAAVAGVVLGLVLPSGGGRKFILVLCCGLVLASAATQAVIGFPISEEVKKDPEFAGGGGGKNDDLGGLTPDDIIRTVYKFPFYLALLFAVGGMVTALIEPVGKPKSKSSPYDFGDDEELPEAKPDEPDAPRKPRDER